MQEKLELLNEWAKRLGVEDWYIILEDNVEPEDMAIQDADGCVIYTETTKSAKVQIVNPEMRKSCLRPFNYEETLVHELLHIKMCLLERGDDWDNKLQLRLLHQIIDDLARALVDSKNNEPVKPHIKDEHHYYCGACDKRLNLKHKYKYCPKCGRKVLWEKTN